MLNMKIIKKLKTSYCVRESSDNRFLCHNTGSKTIIYDKISWEKIVELDKPKHPGYMRFSNNNEYLLIKSTTGTICVYDTTNFQLVQTIQSKQTFKITEGDLNFTQEGLLILDTIETKNGQQIASLKIDSREYEILTEFKTSITTIRYSHFIRDANSHLFTLSYVNKELKYENNIVKVKEPINQNSIETISHPEIPTWDSVIFDSIHDVYVLVKRYTIILVDSDFKTVLNKQDFVNNTYPHDQVGFFRHMHLSNDGRLIVLTFSESIIILRYEDLKTIVLEKIPYACFAEFSNDDQFLLVGTWKNGYVLENNLF